VLTLAAKRLAWAVIILLILASAVYFLQQISPLDPVRAELGAQASAQAVSERRHDLGLDRPLLAQLGH
jgi:peptide/nickel transport system permease protein